MNKKQSTVFAFSLITSLFSLWEFTHNLVPILIPHFQVITEAEKASYNPTSIV